MQVNLGWALKSDEEPALQKCRARGQSVWGRGEGVGKDAGAGKEIVPLKFREWEMKDTVSLPSYLVLSQVLHTRKQEASGLTWTSQRQV